MDRREIKFLPFENLDDLLQQKAIAMLAAEFYAHRQVSEGVEVFDQSLHAGKELAIALMGELDMIGVTTYKVFDFPAIQRQLYIEPQFSQGSLSQIRLRSFQHLLEDAGLLKSTSQRSNWHTPSLSLRSVDVGMAEICLIKDWQR